MIDATPNIPATTAATANQDVKIATPDLIQFNEAAIPIEYMTDLLFEDIGGQEIISISRNDIVNGQKILYSPIKNTTQLSVNFSPLNMFSSIDDTNSYFKNFPISLDQKVPEIGSRSSENEVVELIYIDEITGDLIVNVINMFPDEQVEIQVLNGGNPTGDIIY